MYHKEKYEYKIFFNYSNIESRKVIKKMHYEYKKQKYINYEIIIIDQSEEINYELENDRVVKYIHINKKGLSNARNIGIQYVTGDYICLIDDDAIYPENYLLLIYNSLKKNQVDILCGLMKDARSGKYNISNKDCAIQYISFWSAMKYGISICCVFRTKWLECFKFDDRFGVGRYWGAGEETDIIWRIIENGGVVKFDPSFFVYHDIVSKRDIKIEKLVSYNLGFGALFAKHYYEYKNISALIYFLYSTSRNIVGLFFYLVQCDFLLAKIQITMMKSKFKGFMEFKKQCIDNRG